MEAQGPGTHAAVPVELTFREEHAEEGEHCLVLSYCRGGDLFTWLERCATNDETRLPSSDETIGIALKAMS